MVERFHLFYAAAVANELKEAFPSGRECWRLARKKALSEAPTPLETVKEFGPGERSAINLALEHRDWVLLLDDRRPSVAAGRLGLRVMCTPVLTAELYAEGELDIRQALAVLARLSAMQTVSPNLLAAAMNQLARVRKERGD